MARRKKNDSTKTTGVATVASAQHIIYHLAPMGPVGFVLANGSMLSNQSGECEIRKSPIEADLVDCMVALPGQLFLSTQMRKPGRCSALAQRGNRRLYESFMSSQWSTP